MIRFLPVVMAALALPAAAQTFPGPRAPRPVRLDTDPHRSDTLHLTLIHASRYQWGGGQNQPVDDIAVRYSTVLPPPYEGEEYGVPSNEYIIWYSLATPLPSLTPGLPGSFETFALRGFVEGHTYYIATQSLDVAVGWGAPSEAVAGVTSIDTADPGPVKDISIVGVNSNRVDLALRCPGDDGSLRQLFELRFFHSAEDPDGPTFEGDLTAWTLEAEELVTPPTPGLPNRMQTVLLPIDIPQEGIFVVVQGRDETGRLGPLTRSSLKYVSLYSTTRSGTSSSGGGGGCSAGSTAAGMALLAAIGTFAGSRRSAP